MQNKFISMVQECTDSYRVQKQEDGGIVVHISIPQQFSDLWIMKLSELKTSENELREFQTKIKNIKIE